MNHKQQTNSIGEPLIGVDYTFRRETNGKTNQVRYRRLKDGSAYIFGDEEYGFEGKDDSWRRALDFLTQKGFVFIE